MSKVMTKILMKIINNNKILIFNKIMNKIRINNNKFNNNNNSNQILVFIFKNKRKNKNNLFWNIAKDYKKQNSQKDIRKQRIYKKCC